MASLIPGYNYDIFISYRQKDNKYDGWVTEFVDHLKSELEATFKEEISVYFDLSPHDGLLDTHDVDESLKEKLKCLIFIPIISRTYCDPASFAWEHELKSFVDQASHDQFGLKVKLGGGNVASRVLPVQIHDLKADDRSLVETVLGGFLRSIEFIYSEPGVNRPLTQNDSEVKNINKTNYRNQINKVANAIDEIISGLRAGVSSPPEDNETEKAAPAGDMKDDRQKVKKPDGKKKKVIYSSSSLVITMAVIAFYLFAGGSKLPFEKRDWILITDFDNQTNTPLFDRSLYTAFSLSAAQSSYINIFTRARMLETLRRMKVTDEAYISEDTGREIAIREGIGLFIVPGISEVGNEYSVTAKIIDSETGDILKSEVLYARTQDDILSALDRLSKKIRQDLGESRYNISLQDKPLSKVTTSSLEALKQYSLGIESHLASDFDNARKYYENALKIDTGFIAAKASLGNLMVQKFDPSEGIELLEEAISGADRLTDREKYGIMAFYAENVEHNYEKAINNMDILEKMYPDDPVYHNNLGWYYQQTKQFDDAITEYKKAVSINPHLVLTYGGLLWVYLENTAETDSAFVWAKKMISDNPDNAWGYFYMGSVWVCLDSAANALNCFKKSHEINPDLVLNSYRLAHEFRRQENYAEAITVLKQIIAKHPEETSAYYDLGINLDAIGNQTEARKYFLDFKKIAEEKWMKDFPDYFGTYTSLAAVYARLDEMELSQQMLEKAMSLDSTQYFKFAQVLCLQGDIPATLKYLELALDNGYRNLYWLKTDPELSELKYDIRFRNLIDKYFKPE
jgi:tetratricopeptide (TPR) repeat protein